MNKSIIVLIVLFTVSLLSAQHESAGTTEFELLNNSVDARSIAMAGASVALPSKIYGSFVNPAVIGADTSGSDIMLGYISIMDGLWGIPLAGSRSFGKYGVFAINAFSVAASIEARDENNTLTGETPGYNYLTGGISWGYHLLEPLFLGISFNGVMHRIDKLTAGGLFVNIGAQYRLNSDRLIYGFAIRNLGFVARKYYDGYNPGDFPVTFEGGISFVPRTVSQLRLTIDVNKKVGDYTNFEPALEMNVYKKILALRLGYAFSQADVNYLWDKLKNEEDKDYVKSNLSSICAGIGLKTEIADKKVELDFGLQFKTAMIAPSISISGLIGL